MQYSEQFQSDNLMESLVDRSYRLAWFVVGLTDLIYQQKVFTVGKRSPSGISQYLIYKKSAKIALLKKFLGSYRIYYDSSQPARQKDLQRMMDRLNKISEE